MAKDDDEQAKKSDAKKAARQPAEAREESDADHEEEEDEDGDESDDGDHDAEDHGDDHDDEDDESEDEDDDEAHAAKPAPKKIAPSHVDDEPVAAKPRAARANLARPVPVEAPPLPPPPVASMGKRLFVFAIVLVTLSVGLYFLPQSENAGNGPRFKVPSTNDVTITVIPEDATALACASPQEVAGRKCEFSSKSDKNSGLDDTKMLKPYTALDGAQFLAAGLWSQAALEGSKLPTPGTRFALKCKYVAEGIVKSPLIRWNPTQAWGDKNPDWNAGLLKDCTQVPLEK